MPEASTGRIAIVGGGITGLFCALILARAGRPFSLFEATERLGGRIRTIRLNKENVALDKDHWRNNLSSMPNSVRCGSNSTSSSC
jgi:predicted NAD/FAD-binding protein